MLTFQEFINRVKSRSLDAKTGIFAFIGPEKFLRENLFTAQTKSELMTLAKKGGIIRVNYCGNKDCADYIKAETGGFEVRGKRVDIKEKPDGPCIWCGRKAERVVYVAKPY